MKEQEATQQEDQKVLQDMPEAAEDKEIEIEDAIRQTFYNTREQGKLLYEQQERFDQLIRNQIKVKDAMIDKLHEELDFYKQGSEEKFADQLMKNVIKIRKSMQRLMAADSWETMQADELRREYRYILEDITDLLEQQNVDAYTSTPGDMFDPAIHQAKVETTEDQTADRTIKESISDGYKKGNRVLIPERVIVYRCK